VYDVDDHCVITARKEPGDTFLHIGTDGAIGGADGGQIRTRSAPPAGRAATRNLGEFLL
jgi:hypothetical protein